MNNQVIIRIIAYLAVAAVAFASGYYSHDSNSEVAVKTQTKTVEKVVTKRILIRDTKPDGTVSERTEETETKDNQTIAKDKTNKPDPIVAKAQADKIRQQKHYSLGLQWHHPRLFAEPIETLKPTGFEGGYRVWKDLWLSGGYDWGSTAITFGMRWEF